jgi:hypothetical protein
MKKQYVNRSEPSWIATQREDGNYNLQRADQEYYTVQFKSFIESSNKWIPREEVTGDLWSAFRANLPEQFEYEADNGRTYTLTRTAPTSEDNNPRKETPKEIDLEFEYWEHNCGDGCCYDYGTDIHLNDKRVDFDGISLEVAVKAVLEHLGYKVNEV